MCVGGGKEARMDREIESEKRNTDSEEGRHRERGGDTEKKEGKGNQKNQKHN